MILTMKHCKAALLILFFYLSLIISAVSPVNIIYDDQIKTIKIHPLNDWMSPPVINLETNDQLLLSWDQLSHDYKRYAYRIIHCNRDWSKSDLNQLEYTDGFNENDVNDYERSYNTSTLYTHYKLKIPNDDLKVKCSGNYKLEVFDKDCPDSNVFVTHFMVLEKKTRIEMSVTANTDVDFQDKNQQLRVEVTPVGFSFQQPETEVNIRIEQNQRPDNEVTNIRPLYISPGKLIFEHDKNLIFKAGNEYRRFEITSYKHSGLNVNKTTFFRPFYNVELLPSETRLNGYSYDQDQNGRYLVHNIDYNSDDVCSDYFLVHFTFPMANPWIDGGLYLNGDLVNNRSDKKSKMIYNFDSKAYEATLFLKQGSYNYQYFFIPSSGGKPSVEKTEGSYWQTENEYQVYVYYHPIGERYDKLIGFSQIKTGF